MTNTDRAQLAALDADGMHNTQRMVWEYGEFDTVKDECGWVYLQWPGKWHCNACNMYQRSLVKPKCLSRDRNPYLYSPPEPVIRKLPEPSIIQTRSETHGDFTINSHVSQAIKRAVRSHAGYMNLHDYQKEALDALAGKIGRIVAGDAGFPDHWVDIAGYAELVRERLKK